MTKRSAKKIAKKVAKKVSKKIIKNITRELSGSSFSKGVLKRSKTKLSKKQRKMLKKKVSFGTTPGTKEWKEAEKLVKKTQPVLNYTKSSYKNNSTNIPMQFKDNELNIEKLKKTEIKPSSSFGTEPLEISKNNVGYEQKPLLYKGGGNTMNFLTKKPYIKDIISKTDTVLPDPTSDKTFLSTISSNGTGVNTLYQKEPFYKKITVDSGNISIS